MAPNDFNLDRFGRYAVLQRLDGTIVAVTDGVLELLGYSADELVGSNGWDLTPEANGARIARIRGTLETAGALTDVETVRRKDGTLLRFAYMAQMLDDDCMVVSGEPVPPDGFRTTAAELESAQRSFDASAARARDGLAELPAGRWLTTDESVDYTRRSESTIRRAVDAGLLPRGGTKRRALYHTSWLDRWLAGGSGSLLVAALLLLVLLGVACVTLDACPFMHELGLHHHNARG